MLFLTKKVDMKNSSCSVIINGRNNFTHNAELYAKLNF